MLNIFICVFFFPSICMSLEKYLFRSSAHFFHWVEVFCHIVFIHSSVNGHLGCFYDLAVVNSASMNTGVYVSFSMKVLSG